MNKRIHSYKNNNKDDNFAYQIINILEIKGELGNIPVLSTKTGIAKHDDLSIISQLLKDKAKTKTWVFYV